MVEALLREGRRFRALLLAGADDDPSFVHDRMAVFAPLDGVVRRGQAAGLIRADLPPGWVVAVVASLLASGVRMAPELPADDKALADVPRQAQAPSTREAPQREVARPGPVTSAAGHHAQVEQRGRLASAVGQLLEEDKGAGEHLPRLVDAVKA